MKAKKSNLILKKALIYLNLSNILRIASVSQRSRKLVTQNLKRRNLTQDIDVIDEKVIKSTEVYSLSHCLFQIKSNLIISKTVISSEVSMKQLQHICLSLNAIESNELSNLTFFPCLVGLKMNTCYLSNEKCSFLNSLNNLVYLDLYWNNISDDGCVSISKLKSLKVLSIGLNPISDAGAESLSVLKNLESLNLSWTKITDEAGNFMHKFENLKSLSCRENKVGLKFLQSLKNLSLHSLDFYVEEELTANELDSISRLPLTYLSLNECEMDKDELPVLCRLNKLTELSLMNCDLEEDDLDFLTKMNSLKCVRLKGNELSESFIKRKRKVLRVIC